MLIIQIHVGIFRVTFWSNGVVFSFDTNYVLGLSFFLYICLKTDLEYANKMLILILQVTGFERVSF